MRISSAIALRGLLVLVLAAACTTSGERSDLVATKVVEPTFAGSGTGCELNPGTAELTFGSFDPAVATSYRMGLVVENHLANNSNPAIGRFNTNDFQVEQARIGYEFPDPAFKASIAEHVVPANGLIRQGSSSAVEVVLAPADVIGALKTALAAGQTGTVRFHVRVEGHLNDGSGVNSSRYEYAARACAGCGVGAGGGGPTDGGNGCAAGKSLVSCPGTDGQDSQTTCQ